MASPRYLVGIDLGTTNTVVAFCELTENLQQSNVSLFDIDQLIGPGEVFVSRYCPLSATIPPTGKSPLRISPCRGKIKLWLATLLM